MISDRPMRLIMAILIMAISATAATAQRRVTPVAPQAPGVQAPPPPQQQPVDPSRLVTTLDAQGNSVTVDTVTGREYVDSTMLLKPPPMEYPLLYQASVGINFWDPLMRAFGQKYGLGDVWAELNMHNRYFATFTFGLGSMTDTPVNKNYTFRTPVSPYFKLGAMYNFFYNSNPDYKLLAGLRYGFTPFRWSATDITVDEGYWDDPSHYSLDNIRHTTGYLEVVFGIRVNIWKSLSAGWTVIYHTVLHDSSSPHGQPMYIPGYGKRSGAITGNISLVYTIPINKKLPAAVE